MASARRCRRLFGLKMAERPLSAAQTPWSRAAWCATFTLWVRNVAVELLVEAGAHAAGRAEDRDGRLWWVSPAMRAAIRDLGPDDVVGPEYGGLLRQLLGYIDDIHWMRIHPQRNKVPHENPDGFAPIFCSADFVLFDAERWQPKLPPAFLVRTGDASGVHGRGERLCGELHRYRGSNNCAVGEGPTLKVLAAEYMRSRPLESGVDPIVEEPDDVVEDSPDPASEGATTPRGGVDIREVDGSERVKPPRCRIARAYARIRGYAVTTVCEDGVTTQFLPEVKALLPYPPGLSAAARQSLDDQRHNLWRRLYTHVRGQDLMGVAGVSTLTESEALRLRADDLDQLFGEVRDVARHGKLTMVDDDPLERRARARALRLGLDVAGHITALAQRRRRAALELVVLQYFLFHELRDVRCVATAGALGLAAFGALLPQGDLRPDEVPGLP